MQRAFSHTSRERKGKRGANEEPSIPSQRRLSLTRCHLPCSLALFSSSDSVSLLLLTTVLGFVRWCDTQPGEGCAGAEQSIRLSSLSLRCRETGGKHLPCNASPKHAPRQLRDGARGGNFARISPSATYFLLPIHAVSHTNFWVMASVWISCLRRILLRYPQPSSPLLVSVPLQHFCLLACASSTTHQMVPPTFRHC